MTKVHYPMGNLYYCYYTPAGENRLYRLDTSDVDKIKSFAKDKIMAQCSDDIQSDIENGSSFDVYNLPGNYTSDGLTMHDLDELDNLDDYLIDSYSIEELLMVKEE